MNPQKPNVSVVIPTYNSSQFIVETLESVFNQTYKDYEIIVVDDGSSDNTQEILAPYMSRIQYIYKENGGPASARNVGIENARGDYIAFLDSDDLWFPEKLEKQLEYFRNNPDLGLVFCECILFSDDGIIQRNSNFPIPQKGNMFYQLLDANFIATLTVMAKKECFDREGYFDGELNGSEDFDMWIRISRYYNIGHISEPLAKHRVRKDGHNRSNINRAYETSIRAINKAVSSVENGSFDKEKYLKTRLSEIHHNWGLSHFNNDNFHEARRQFLTIIKGKHPKFIIIVYYFLTFLPPNQIRILRKLKQIFSHKMAHFTF